MSDRIEVRYTDWFIAELEELPADQQARVVARLALLERKGWGISVRDRDVVHLQDGIYEVRVVGTGAAYRVLGFVEPGHPGRLVVATSCVSKGSMKKGGVMAGELTRARNRRALWRERRIREGPDGT
jgi:hypothetical protein